MKWTITGQHTSVKDVILKKSGLTEQGLINPQKVSPLELHNMKNAAEAILSAVASRTPITIIGDYDADGITATAILVKLIRFLGGSPKAIIPKRFTDGYGIPKNAIADAPEGLIITVDNGITAIDEIKLAKAMNHQVVIIDHHIPGPVLPEADIIVDPHVDSDKNAYTNYCGAGLAFKLSELMLEGTDTNNARKLLLDLTVLACIGTIADVMELKSDNRRIVMDGLRIMNESAALLSCGISLLINSAGIDTIDADSIGYKIAPLINAPGRLYNAGGTSVLKALLNDDRVESITYSAKMQEINNQRKSIANEWYDKISRALSGSSENVIVHYAPDIPEGIVGIVTGKLAEEYKVPAFIFTDSLEHGVVKGSGRSYGGCNLHAVITHINSITETSGGHFSAAGVTVRKENYSRMETAITEYMAANKVVVENDHLYDIELHPSEIKQALTDIKRFAPFGEGVPKPVIVVKNFQTTRVKGAHYQCMGSAKEHLKLFGDEFSAVAFNYAPEYISMNCPPNIDLLGTIGENTFNGRTTIQFMVADIRATI